MKTMILVTALFACACNKVPPPKGKEKPTGLSVSKVSSENIPPHTRLTPEQAEKFKREIAQIIASGTKQ